MRTVEMRPREKTEKKASFGVCLVKGIRLGEVLSLRRYGEVSAITVGLELVQHRLRHPRVPGSLSPSLFLSPPLTPK